jgi:hypothetical protein
MRLFDRTRRAVDDDMLSDIASADYGYRAVEMMALLIPIRDTGMIPVATAPSLAEVLGLIRWSDPDRPNSPPFSPGPSGLRGHLTRLFACALLLHIEVISPYGDWDGTNDSTLANGIISAKLLGNEFTVLLGCFLTWRLTQSEQLTNPLFSAIGLLMVAINRSADRFPDSILENRRIQPPLLNLGCIRQGLPSHLLRRSYVSQPRVVSGASYPGTRFPPLLYPERVPSPIARSCMTTTRLNTMSDLFGNDWRTPYRRHGATLSG